MTPPERAATRRRLAIDPRRPAPASDRPRHLDVVRGRPAPGRRPPVGFVATAAAATLMALFVVVALNALVGHVAMERAAVRDAIRARQLEIERLEVAVDRLRAPARIEERARELGLAPASGVIVLTRPAVSPARSGAGQVD